MTAPRAPRLALCALLSLGALLCAVSATESLAAPAAAVQLAKDRAAAAEKVYRWAAAAHAAGRVTAETVYAWSLRWLDAALDATPRAARQALAEHQKRMADLEAATQKLFTAGSASALDADGATYFRLEAELWLARGRR